MSSNLMSTSAGGEEQGSYEEKASAYPSEGQPHSKSSGQLGDPSDMTTTDPSKAEGQKENQPQGQSTADGMGANTTQAGGEAAQGGFGRVGDHAQQGVAVSDRQASGYGGKEDVNNDIGA